MTTSSVNTTAPTTGSTQPGSPRLGRISILTVNAPKNRHPTTEWIRTRVLYCWKPSAYRQWIATGTPTDYGVPVTAGLVVRMLREELDVLAETGALDEESARCFGQARTLLTVLLTERTCPEFLTLPAYLRHMTGGNLAPAVAQPA